MRRHVAPFGAAASMISGCRSAASGVANSSLSRPFSAAASRTACGPSARNSRCLARKAREASRRAATTLVDFTEVIIASRGPAVPERTAGS